MGHGEEVQSQDWLSPGWNHFQKEKRETLSVVLTVTSQAGALELPITWHSHYFIYSSQVPSTCLCSPVSTAEPLLLGLEPALREFHGTCSHVPWRCL